MFHPPFSSISTAEAEKGCAVIALETKVVSTREFTDVRRKLPVAVAAILVAAVAAGCSSSSTAADGGEVTKIRYQSLDGGLNYIELADALGYLDTLSLDRVGEVVGRSATRPCRS